MMRVFHFLKVDHALQALENGRIKIATIPELNDPFELLCPDMRDPHHREGFRKFKARCAATFGFVCFTPRWQNLMMWSMYADKHKGAALEIELDDGAALPVKYRRLRVRLDVEQIMKEGDFSSELVDLVTQTKSYHWKYEKEIRDAVKLGEAERDGNLYFSTADIRGIVLGPLSTITEKQISDALPFGKSIAVTYTRLAFRSYGVVRRRDQPVAVINGAGQQGVKAP